MEIKKNDVFTIEITDMGTDGEGIGKVYADTVLVKFPLFCPKCKKEIIIDVVQLKMVISK